ncbi:unnamed protein product [Heterobilharzia americana]|nr:unnamed protein product [Heterobilharzia americana]
MSVNANNNSEEVAATPKNITNVDNSGDESTEKNRPPKRKCSPVLEDSNTNLQDSEASTEDIQSDDLPKGTEKTDVLEENIAQFTEQTIANRKCKKQHSLSDSAHLSTNLKSPEYLRKLEEKHKSQVKRQRQSRFSISEITDTSSINTDPVELEVNTLVHDETCMKFSRSLYVTYPNNLTLTNMYYFMFAPTLCYELNFPRTLTIRKQFLFKRVFELIFIPQLILCMIQQWILPTLSNSFTPLAEARFSLIVERCLKLAIPNHLIWLMFFYLVFHSLLNVIGEILYFGDRFFYSDWWNAESILNSGQMEYPCTPLC